MSIDRQRIKAVALINELGYAWRDGDWKKPDTGSLPIVQGTILSYGVLPVSPPPTPPPTPPALAAAPMNPYDNIQKRLLDLDTALRDYHSSVQLVGIAIRGRAYDHGAANMLQLLHLNARASGPTRSPINYPNDIGTIDGYVIRANG